MTNGNSNETPTEDPNTTATGQGTVAEAPAQEAPAEEVAVAADGEVGDAADAKVVVPEEATDEVTDPTDPGAPHPSPRRVRRRVDQDIFE
jgi:hypothetical protein